MCKWTSKPHFYMPISVTIFSSTYGGNNMYQDAMRENSKSFYPMTLTNHRITLTTHIIKLAMLFYKSLIDGRVEYMIMAQ
jgi:hypothetical protein